MKKFVFFILVCLFTSCANYYNFVQIQKYSINEDNSLIYDNVDCSVNYSNIFSTDGLPFYTVYNKTEHFLFIDKSKSFIIDYNGEAHNCVEFKEQVSLTNKSFYEGQAFNKQYHTTNKIEYTEYISDSVLIIPPKSYKKVAFYGDNVKILLHCDLPKYPSSPKSIALNSPVLTVLTTYRINNEYEKTIKNTIFLNKVTNTPEYIIAKYIQRTTNCENMRTGNQYEQSMFDLYYDVEKNNVTLPYKVYSYVKYYDHKKDHYKNDYRGGYVKIR